MTGPGLEPFPARLRRLRQDRGWSRSTLSRKTVDYDGRGLAEATVKAVEVGTNRPGPDTIVALAHALGVAPEEFPEYRLALARQQLDEREVGLDQAVEALTQIEAALQRPRKVAAREAEQAEASPEPSRASRTAGRTRRAT